MNELLLFLLIPFILLLLYIGVRVVGYAWHSSKLEFHKKLMEDMEGDDNERKE